MFFTDRLMLRAIDQDTDSKVMQQWLNDVDFQWACSPTPAVPNNRGMVKQFIEKAADNANRLSFFMICEKPNDDARPECLGADDDYFGKEGKARYPAIGIFNVGRDPVSLRTARFGIALDKQHQNKGYGTEVMRWAIRYCFKTHNMHRIELELVATNVRALHVYEKIGFVREGLRRKNIWADGRWIDTIEMGLLEDEWRAKNGEDS